MNAQVDAPKASRPSFAFAKRNGATLARWDGETAIIACRRGVKPQVLAEVKRHLRAPLRLELLDEPAFEALLQRLYEHGGEDARQMAADLGDEIDLDQIADALPEPEDLLEAEDDAPIIRLINALLTEAVKENASDIHIEPQETRLVVRFRVDGVLREVLSPPRNLAAVIVSRIKVMARLDIAEKRLPQDGRISLKVAGRPVDVRVSTIPAGHGERVVLRLLDKQAGRLDLRQLGARDSIRHELAEALARPHGIILVTGPTGSGKTTTLYAGLAHLNDSSRNIMTVEDPIEYYLDGIGQTQVNSKVDMSFARGLRAILRQDPDVVMVGEIRDLETAQIAVQASLTGHLVLSTLHTNSAIGAVARLRDMGVEPFLLSSSLVAVLAQRLVRKLDPEQREQYEATEAECKAFGHKGPPPQIWRPRVDLFNRGTGYRGRTGIYELVTVDQQLRDLIHKSAGESALAKHIRKTSDSLLTDGWHKIMEGVTSAEEVLRVTHSD